MEWQIGHMSISLICATVAPILYEIVNHYCASRTTWLHASWSAGAVLPSPGAVLPSPGAVLPSPGAVLPSLSSFRRASISYTVLSSGSPDMDITLPSYYYAGRPWCSQLPHEVGWPPAGCSAKIAIQMHDHTISWPRRVTLAFSISPRRASISCESVSDDLHSNTSPYDLTTVQGNLGILDISTKRLDFLRVGQLRSTFDCVTILFHDHPGFAGLSPSLQPVRRMKQSSLTTAPRQGPDSS
jgi:hypothetical protein